MSYILTFIQLSVLRLLASAEVGLGFLLSVFGSPSAASVGRRAVGASRQPLLLGPEMDQQIRWYSWQQDKCHWHCAHLT